MWWTWLAWLVLLHAWVGRPAWYGGHVSVGLPFSGAFALPWWCPCPLEFQRARTPPREGKGPTEGQPHGHMPAVPGLKAFIPWSGVGVAG